MVVINAIELLCISFYNYRLDTTPFIGKNTNL